MDNVDRRAYLQQMAEDATSEQTRFKALQLLDALDQREAKVLPTAEEFADAEIERLADNPTELDKLVEAYADTWFAFPAIVAAIETRAEAIVEERAVAARAAMKVAIAPERVEEPGLATAGAD